MIELIEKVICGLRKIDPLILHSKSRKDQVNETRQIIVFFALEKKMTQWQAGSYFGRNHATAHHSKIAINDLCDTEKDFAKMIGEYRIEIDKAIEYEKGMIKINLTDFIDLVKSFGELVKRVEKLESIIFQKLQHENL